MWWWLLVCPLPRLHCFLLPGQIVSTSGQPSLLFLDTGFNFSWHRVYTSMTPSLLFHDTGFNLSWQRVCTFMTPSLHVHDIGFKLPWRRVHKFRTMHLNFHDAEFTLSWHRVYTFMTPSFNFHDTEFTLPWHRVYTSMTPSLHFHDAEFTLSWRRVYTFMTPSFDHLSRRPMHEFWWPCLFFLSFFDDLDSFLENYVRLYMYCMMKEFPVLTASGLRVCSSRYFERHSEISATIQKEVELWVKIWTLAVTIRHSNTREGGCNTRPFI